MGRRQRVRRPYFEGLQRVLATGNFRPDLVALPGGITLSERFFPPPALSRGAVQTAPPQANGAPPPPLPQKTHQRPGLRIHRAINEATNQGGNIPATDDGCNFCLNFHLKEVCNRNCGSQQSQRALYQSKFDRLVGWNEKFYGKEAAPPV